MGDPMAPSEGEGNSEGEVHEQAGRLGMEEKAPSSRYIKDQFPLGNSLSNHGYKL
jgi:hypothetical protein